MCVMDESPIMRMNLRKRKKVDGSPALLGGRMKRRQYSLERKLIVWSVLLIVLPTLVCALGMNAIAGREIERGGGLSADLLTKMVASSLSGEINERWTAEANQVIESVMEDQRVAAVAVYDRDGELVNNRVRRPEAWKLLKNAGLGMRLGNAVKMKSGEVLRVGKRTIDWGEGEVVIGVIKKGDVGTQERMRSGVLIVGLIVLGVMLPIAVVMVRMWSKPIRELAIAIEMLGKGKKPGKVKANTGDELQALTESFNAMTERLFATQEELAEVNKGLEEKVCERTGELEKANKKLKAELADKNEFLQVVSHDLSAPVRNISGLTQMLMMKQGEDLSDDAKRKLERIAANAKVQTDLIKDLLELSRIRMREGKREKIDLNKLVRGVVYTLQWDMEKAGVEFRCGYGLPVIWADKNRLRQVFQNLIDNAVKYMLDSEERRIELRYELRKGEHVFCLKDTGCGIAERDLERIFQVFGRSVYSGSHQVEGRGVGLTSVKHIVERYEGKVWANSKLGEGSKFYVSLPIGAVCESGNEGAGKRGQDKPLRCA